MKAKMLEDVYSSWDSMKLKNSITVKDIARMRIIMVVGRAFKITTDVYTRAGKRKYTNWATVVENYPYHCVVEMYYDNGYETLNIRRDVQYTELLQATLTKTVPYISAGDDVLDKEVSI